jgi:STE24 endopeptidase
MQRRQALRLLGVGDFVLSGALLTALLVTNWGVRLRDAAFWLSGNYSVALFLYVLMLSSLAKLFGTGFDLYHFRLEKGPYWTRRELRIWLNDEIKGFMVGLFLLTLLVEPIYFIIRLAPRGWWLISWAFFMFLFVLFAQLAPVALFPVFYPHRPIDDEEVEQRILHLNERAGTRISGVYVSGKQQRRDCSLSGMGRTRRLIISDDLLTLFSHDEIEAVVAHLIGIHAKKHVQKSIFLQAGITLLGFWTIHSALEYGVRTHRFTSTADFATIPLVGLLAQLISFVIMPLLNSISRSRVFEADRYALDLIQNPEQYLSALNKLADHSDGQDQKSLSSRVSQIFFNSHPTIWDRIEVARNYVRVKSGKLRLELPLP